MATTTPNFGWPVPTSSDLVKNGATAIEGLGDAIDAALLDLKGGTTGQVLKKNTNTDMDFVWGADSAGMTNPMTTTGDTIYASSGSTPARLGIGSTGNVLTVSGGVPVWSAPAGGGGMTLLSTTTLSGASTTISSISGSYKQLVAYIFGVNGTNNGFEMTIEPNGTASICTSVVMQNTNGSASLAARDASSISIAAQNKHTTNNATTLIIDNYATSTNYKPFQYFGFVENSGGTFIQAAQLSGGVITNTAISSLKFNCLVTGTFNAGTVELYGVN